MYEEIVKKIADELKVSDDALYPKFSSDLYGPVKIEDKNYHKIETAKPGKKLVFVDGGNFQVISSSNFSLNLVRVAYSVFLNNKKVESKRSEFFSFVNSVNEDGEIHFYNSIYPISESKFLDELQSLSFSSLDDSLMRGNNRAEISTVVNAVRRFSEICLAKYICDEKIGDIIILDGNLEANFKNEEDYLGKLYDSCQKNDAILCALSKSSSLFADNAKPLSVVINKSGAWYYYPIVNIKSEKHRAEMFFVKLHDKARSVFRFEIFNKQLEKAHEVISLVSSNSKDPIFIGYPYGLVHVDSIARVSKQEVEMYKTMIVSRLKGEDLQKYVQNSHEVLDKISF